MSKVRITAETPDGEKIGAWETDDDGRHTMLADPDDVRARDPFSQEAQLEWLRAGVRSASGNPRADRLGRKLAGALDKLDASEIRLSRALREWDKRRAQVRRLHREIDKLERCKHGRALEDNDCPECLAVARVPS